MTTSSRPSVIIAVGVWGEHHRQNYADLSLPSLLADHNLPALLKHCDCIFHIATPRADHAWLMQQRSIQRLKTLCKISWVFIEDVARDFARQNKYLLLSQLQNLAIRASADHSAIVFNYADFIWADGSLYAAVDKIGTRCEAVLTFALPCERSTISPVLRPLVQDGVLKVSNRALAALAIDHLHTDARTRFWDARPFTRFPSYLLWPVGDQGLIVRAYHQTILAMRTHPGDAEYLAGIKSSTLDNDYVETLPRRGPVTHATDSDDTMVLSMYSLDAKTTACGQARDDYMRQFLLSKSAAGHRREFASACLRVKRNVTDIAQWDAVERSTGTLIARLHAGAPSAAVA